MPEPDQSSFADEVTAVYKAKRTVLVQYARRCLRDARIPASRLSAEDVVQNAIVIALVNHEKKPIADLGAYVYKVIANQVRDETKRRGLADPIDWTEHRVEHQKVLWVSEVEDVDGRLDAEKALRKMSPQQRRLLLLAKGAGYSHQELAQQTNLHRGTIAQHIARATQALTAGLGVFVALLSGIYWTLRYLEVVDSSSASGGHTTSATAYVAVILAALGAFPFIVFVGRWRTKKARSEEIRDSHVLREMIRVQQEVRDQVGRDFPGPSDYAAQLDFPKKWIIEDTLRNGRVSIGLGSQKSVPLHIFFPPNKRVTGITPSLEGPNVIHLQPLPDQEHDH